MNSTQELQSTRNTAALEQFRRDVLGGLRRTPRELPCKYFYDERGSRLFDEICELEEYYPTRTELAILRTSIHDIARCIGPDCFLMEFGSGSSIKTRLLLDHLHRLAVYVPIDISRAHLYRSAARLSRRYPGLDVRPVCADFTQPIPLPETARWSARRVMFFPGSTIGNFVPQQARDLLARIRELCEAGGSLIIGVDLKKDRRVLERAYNDARGVTAAFNLNMLERINRELAGDFQLEQFRHHATYNSRHSRIEMHLVSQCMQTVHVGAESFSFHAGEAIVTEYSHKYTISEFRALAADAGWDLTAAWCDDRRWFAVLHFQATK